MSQKIAKTGGVMPIYLAVLILLALFLSVGTALNLSESENQTLNTTNGTGESEPLVLNLTEPENLNDTNETEGFLEYYYNQKASQLLSSR